MLSIAQEPDAIKGFQQGLDELSNYTRITSGGAIAACSFNGRMQTPSDCASRAHRFALLTLQAPATQEGPESGVRKAIAILYEPSNANAFLRRLTTHRLEKECSSARLVGI